MKSFFTKKKLTVIVILFLVIFAGSKIFASSTKNGKSLETTKVARGNLQEIMTISGEVVANEDALIGFQTGGQVSWVGVKVGDKVQKYQAIAALDQRDIQKRITKYLNTYTQTRNGFDQLLDDDKDKVLTDAVKRTLNNTQMSLNNSVLDVELSDLSRQFANLWTPIEGIVVRADIKQAGINISLPSQSLFEIVNPKSVYIEATADQTEVVRLREAMEGSILLDSYPESTLKGKIENISFIPKTGETGTVYTVKFVFDNDNSDYKYRLGMTGDLNFVVDERDNVLFVPSKYIMSANGEKYVSVLKNGKSEKAKVEIGLETEEGTEIISGLVEGDTIHD